MLDHPNVAGNHGRFPFNKNSCLKFRQFHVPSGTSHSGCTDPTQAAARLVIVLVSRIQKSGTRNNNFVKWKGTFRSDRPKLPDRSCYTASLYLDWSYNPKGNIKHSFGWANTVPSFQYGFFGLTRPAVAVQG